MELTMDITANSDRGTDWLDIALFNQELLDFLAEDAEVSLREDAAVSDLLQPGIGTALGSVSRWRAGLEGLAS